MKTKPTEETLTARIKQIRFINEKCPTLLLSLEADDGRKFTHATRFDSALSEKFGVRELKGAFPQVANMSNREIVVEFLSHSKNYLESQVSVTLTPQLTSIGAQKKSPTGTPYFNIRLNPKTEFTTEEAEELVNVAFSQSETFTHDGEGVENEG